MIRQTFGGKLLHDLKHRGLSAWMLSAALIFFYLVLYFGYDKCGAAGRAPGEACGAELGPFASMQLFLYDHFTRHLDAQGGTLMAPFIEHFSAGLAYAILFGAIAASSAWLGFTFRDDPDKLKRVGVASVAAAVFGVLFVRAFFAGDPAELSASDFSRWTVYGLLYTVAILGGGAYMSWKYKHNKYQAVRTLVVMFIQVSFAFSVPILLKFFHHPEYYFSYLWPLKFDALNPSNFDHYGEVFVLYGFFASLLLMPVMTVLYGKRWYCSWVCGCGGLANTFGEPWRHLSDKSSAAWKIEKVTIHPCSSSPSSAPPSGLSPRCCRRASGSRRSATAITSTTAGSSSPRSLARSAPGSTPSAARASGAASSARWPRCSALSRSGAASASA